MIRRFARPYARALMDVAGSPQAANAVRGELMRFEAALTTSAELRALYSNPGITSDQKMAIAQQLAKKMKLGELAVKFLEVLVRSNRINDLGAILEGHRTNDTLWFWLDSNHRCQTCAEWRTCHAGRFVSNRCPCAFPRIADSSRPA